MNHGNLGYLSSDHTIRLPRDVLRPLAASNGSELHGMYYASDREPKPGVQPVRYDFMLTPIKHFYWPRVARYTIRVHHMQGVLAALTKEIEEEEATIVFTEATRSSHRYDTWNLTLAFPKVLIQDNEERDSETGAYLNTRITAHRLEERLLANCDDYLFSDPKDELRSESVQCDVNTALAYFFELSNERKDDPTSKLLRFVTLGDGKITCPNQSFQEVLLRLASRDKLPLLPSFVFAEMDTTDQNLRMSLLPESADSKRFIGVQANWQNTTLNDGRVTTIGLLHDILRCFDDTWNVWRISSKTLHSRKKYESGRVNFLVESKSDFFDLRAVTELLSRTYKSTSRLENCFVEFDSLSLTDIFRRLNPGASSSPWAELVISCSQGYYEDGNTFGTLLRNNGFDARELWNIPGGRRASQVIAERIRESKALFALVDHRMSKGDAALGVRDEVMIALGAGITVIPVAFGRHKTYDFSDLPHYFDSTQGIHIVSSDPNEPLGEEQVQATLQEDLAKIQRALRHSVSWMSD